MSEEQQTDGRKTKVFISYSRKDRQFAANLTYFFKQKTAYEVFRDTEDILPTEEWKQRLEQLISEADTIVFALSPHSSASEVCAWEVEYAEGLNKRIAPIVIRDVPPAKIPKALTKYNYIFFTKKDDFNKTLANLVKALNTDIDWIREHTRLGELARKWDAQRKPLNDSCNSRLRRVGPSRMTASSRSSTLIDCKCGSDAFCVSLTYCNNAPAAAIPRGRLSQPKLARSRVPN